jgi:hypothetical protein
MLNQLLWPNVHLRIGIPKVSGVELNTTREDE